MDITEVVIFIVNGNFVVVVVVEVAGSSNLNIKSGFLLYMLEASDITYSSVWLISSDIT